MIRPACLGVTLLLAACAAAPAGPPPELAAPLECGADADWQGPGPRVALYASRSAFAAAYAALHRNRRPAPRPPAVDFGREAVAAVLLGMRPTAGYGLRLADAFLEGEALVVVVVERRPPPGAITAQVITSPYCLVRLARGAWRTVRVQDPEGHRLGEAALEGP